MVLRGCQTRDSVKPTSPLQNLNPDGVSANAPQGPLSAYCLELVMADESFASSGLASRVTSLSKYTLVPFSHGLLDATGSGWRHHVVALGGNIAV